MLHDLPNPLENLPLKALIFDMDGTLIHNMHFHRRAWVDFLGQHGIRLTEEEFEHYNHGTGLEIIRRLFGAELPAADVQRLVQEKEALYRQQYGPHLRALPGLREFLTVARAQGLRLALATAGDAPNIDFVLDGLQLRPYFDAIIGAEQVQRGKPDPEVFLLAAAALGVAPAECLVFEDSMTGIEAARRAGMAAVGLATTHPAAELQGLGLAQIAADYTHLHLPERRAEVLRWLQPQ
ncbi:HAD family hydrolase [Hymenobacter jeollabukensis]|uniref:Beta-phosphoglucomutase n=1 Tax=Hymenobacter jeollabukensis TaxID=2025313 RepID=A0A5R8WPN6_9BACT|nr:HAD family phosphatase [Hymenobacter jeollabukensis]TLM92273.1 HAD family phosphatase [Hymenobacter jeollabukensis]